MEVLLAAVAVIALAVIASRLRRPTRTTRPSTRPRAGTRRAYPGDFTGRPTVSYSPTLDGRADPGEVVWTWVPFEEDFSRGKDRPVLLIGRDGDWLLGLMLTSKDHDLDAVKEARWGRHWLDIGTGAWDGQRRPSEVRLDRIVRVDPAAVRREGAILDRTRFDSVIDAAKKRRCW
ncbi:type II toxin-antitoxin system PemK/MazF family toxin [Demequina sp. NBRC 110057]|uniref:type II toxin-antitoxin system PemK/MazF family toxin n=1 Tax=Demequina sp. NBRC 110057 TaxID=1570346 RepID=UPI0009FF0084|nr:type II toxin-antitoxin system PemK/MazF family toxin [Demequina sp. NBRC 110057]